MTIARIAVALLAGSFVLYRAGAEEPSSSLDELVAAIRKNDGRVTYRAQGLEQKICRVQFGCHSEAADELFARVALLPDLEELSTISCGLTDKGLSHLQKLAKLTQLGINSDAITDQGIAEVVKLKQLRILRLMRCKLTDRSLALLRELPELESLSLTRIRFSPDALASLKNFPKLKRLYLGQVPYQDADLRALHTLTGLTELSIGGAKASSEAIAELRKALPGVQIAIQ